MTYINTFETQEAAALADLDAELAAVARTASERAGCIDAAQAADLAASDEGRQAREAARMAAIAADAALKTGARGRPPISDERLRYRALCEQHDESPDRFKLAMQRYTTVIASLKAARPELDGLQRTADDQAKLAQQTVEHLQHAADAYAKAADLADSGKSTMARLSDLVAFSASPFIDLTQGRNELRDLHKRWALRLAAELARLGRDQESELLAQRQRRADAEYRKALDAAAKSYRKTGDGRAAWQNYKQATRELEAGQAAQPQGDFTGLRECAQRLLTQFYGSAATQANLEFKAEAVPQV